MELDEEDKEKNLKKLNDVIKPLNHAVNKPVQKNAYDIWYVPFGIAYIEIQRTQTFR